MNSPELAPQHALRESRNITILAAVATPRQGRAGTAPNDDATPTDLGHSENPLWVMVIALGVFCAVAALLIAFG